MVVTVYVVEKMNNNVVADDNVEIVRLPPSFGPLIGHFKVLGGIDLAALTDKFEGNEKFVCRSLTSWVHDGSHCLYDGIELGFGQDLADLYLPVFKKIFEQTQHGSHYEMMMSSC